MRPGSHIGLWCWAGVLLIAATAEARPTAARANSPGIYDGRASTPCAAAKQKRKRKAKGAKAKRGKGAQAVSPDPELEVAPPPAAADADPTQPEGSTDPAAAPLPPALPAAPAADAAAPATDAPVPPPPPGPATPPPLAGPLPPLPEKYRAVGILPLEAIGVGDELVHATEDTLFNDIDEHPGMRAITPSDVLSELAAVGLDPRTCNRDVACLAAAGLRARAHLSLETRLSWIGGTPAVSFRLIDNVKGQELGRVAENVGEEPTTRALDIHRLLVKLLAPDSYVGALSIQSAIDGAEVFLDDRPIGTTPLPAELPGLTAGTHILRVYKPGYAELNEFVDVAYKRTTTIQVDLSKTTISGVVVAIPSKDGYGALFVTANEAGVEVRVDGEPVGMTPLGGAVTKLAVGKRRVSFRKAGLSADIQEIEIGANERVDIALSVTADGIQALAVAKVAETDPLPTYQSMTKTAALSVETPIAAPPVVVRGNRWRWPTGLVALGVAVVSGGLASYFGAQAADRTEQATQARGDLVSGTITAQEYLVLRERLDREGPRYSGLSYMSLGGTIVAGLVGGGLLAWDLLDPEPAAPAPSVTGVQVRWRLTPFGLDLRW